jgi:hypothetical protein
MITQLYYVSLGGEKKKKHGPRILQVKLRIGPHPLCQQTCPVLFLDLSGPVGWRQISIQGWWQDHGSSRSLFAKPPIPRLIFHLGLPHSVLMIICSCHNYIIWLKKLWMSSWGGDGRRGRACGRINYTYLFVRGVSKPLFVHTRLYLYAKLKNACVNSLPFETLSRTPLAIRSRINWKKYL